MSEEHKNIHYLVVDDDEESRNTIVEYLRTLGAMKITQAQNGADGLRRLDNDSTINFIISDWDMPVMNGASFLQQIRTRPHKAHLPFLMVTSPISNEYEKVMMAAESMVNAYIIKPFRISTLQEKIDLVLQLSIHGPSKPVVVVDDDEDARKMVVEYLESFGFKQINEFKNGKEALDFIKKDSHNIGLIIADWEMPQMTGLELLRVCKGSDVLSAIPFLMVTSQTSMEQMKVVQAAKSNVDQYLLKPFTATKLKDKVDHVIEKARHRGTIAALVREGRECLERGNTKKAQGAFNDALKLDPNNELAQRGLGDVQLKSGSSDAALPFFKKACNSNPYAVTNYLRLASTYELLGLFDKAIAALKAGIEHISFSADLHYALGALFYKKKLGLQAKKEFERCLELQLDHKEAKLMLERLNQGGSSF